MKVDVIKQTKPNKKNRLQWLPLKAHLKWQTKWNNLKGMIGYFHKLQWLPLEAHLKWQTKWNNLKGRIGYFHKLQTYKVLKMNPIKRTVDNKIIFFFFVKWYKTLDKNNMCVFCCFLFFAGRGGPGSYRDFHQREIRVHFFSCEVHPSSKFV